MIIYKIPQDITTILDAEDGKGLYIVIKELRFMFGAWELKEKKVYLKDCHV